MSRVRAQAARARLAVVACVLWLGAVVGTPALHEATHDEAAPHRHDSGSIVTVVFEDATHRHPDGSIHFASATGSAAGAPAGDAAHRHGHGHRDQQRHQHRDQAPGDQPQLTDAADAGHAADGLAHHAAALASPPPPAIRPLPIERRPCSVIVDRTIELVPRDPLAASARGPPALG